MNHDSSQSNSISCVRVRSVGVTENLVACEYLSPRILQVKHFCKERGRAVSRYLFTATKTAAAAQVLFPSHLQGCETRCKVWWQVRHCIIDQKSNAILTKSSLNLTKCSMSLVIELGWLRQTNAFTLDRVFEL